MAMTVPDEGYSRDASFVLNEICLYEFLFPVNACKENIPYHSKIDKNNIYFRHILYNTNAYFLNVTIWEFCISCKSILCIFTRFKYLQDIENKYSQIMCPFGYSCRVTDTICIFPAVREITPPMKKVEKYF